MEVRWGWGYVLFVLGAGYDDDHASFIVCKPGLASHLGFFFRVFVKAVTRMMMITVARTTKWTIKHHHESNGSSKNTTFPHDDDDDDDG